MILLNTKFYVDKELTRKVLFDLIYEWLEWLSTSERYDLDVGGFDFSQSDFKVESSDGTQKVIINNYDNKFIYQMIKSDDVAKFTNSFILDDKSDKHIMAVQIEKEQLQATVTQDKSFFLPRLMKDIFWHEYGGDDNGLMTDDKAYILRKSDVKFASDILNRKISFLNPIVYVTPYLNSGNYSVNYDKIARELIGLAHVVVEGSPKVSIQIREETDSKKAFDGAVDIFLPNGEYKRLTPPSDKEFNYCIVNEVRAIMQNLIVENDFNVLKIRHNHKIQALQMDPELQKIFDEIIAEKEEELTLKDEIIGEMSEELTECKARIMRLTAKAASLQHGFESQDVASDIQIMTSEHDLYEGEMLDVLLRLIQKEVNAMSDDSNLNSSRKYHVLKSILDGNNMTGKREELIDIFKSAFKDGSLSSDGIRTLEMNGFTVQKEKGDSHYKIRFVDDNRYQIVFPSTTSDKKCAAENNISAFSNILFGY